ncbi:TonB-dependent hemoglobin/transferrin/lactoferrin family receptor [Thalassotalea euphylliae]|uniref:TonB-dependent hemoglobin/transferrin/lactoferrin family receptor n=1 Tax=Thalassotalea euphylliae TaxID=1655234 RepID=A0A3E0UFV9_9GAMM|nr:TonB-dependent hemoglobin/transferrin/lactoferrin family receptor [Thalassotalea euphylliae]REL35035.1 TonB-dependent hemoglobin/transferrin/lactoferrin family receptor [Thalassotalea euphylliae]
MKQHKHKSLFLLSPLALALTGATSLLAPTAFAEDDDAIVEHIIVSGARIEQNLGDVAGSVTVVTEEDIERQLITNLNTMFRYDPSISVEGNGAQAQGITVRGVGGNRLVYIKDGRRTNDAYAGGGSLIVGRGYFDSYSIKQVEVAKGAASSLYGSDGLGGIVVISTKDPLDYLGSEKQHLALSAGYQGENEQTEFNLTGATYLGDWATSAVVGIQSGSEVQNFDEELPGYDSDGRSLLLKTFKQLDNDHSIKFTLDYYQQEVDQIVSATNSTENDDTSWAVSVDFHSTAKTAWYDSWQSQAYFSRYEQESEQVRAVRGSTSLDYNAYDFEQDIVGLRNVFAKQIAQENVSHQLVYGLDYDQYDTLRPRFKTRVSADGSTEFSNEPQKAFPGADTTLAGVFLQDTIKFNDSGLSLVAGARFDYYNLEAKSNEFFNTAELDDYNETALSPKLAAIYQLNEQVSVYAQYVAGFKIPPHDQAYQSHGVEPFYQILPNNDLDAEESDSFELGLRAGIDDWRFNAIAFYSQFDNFIETKLVGTEPTFIPSVNKSLFQYQNVSETEIQGIELEGEYWFNDSLSVAISAAYADGENKETDQALTTVNPLNGNIRVNYNLTDWQLTAAWRLAKRMTDLPTDSQGNDLATTAGYGLVDLFARYQVANWTLDMAVTNAFDKEYTPYSSIAGQAANANLNQYTQAGRNVSAQVSYSF